MSERSGSEGHVERCPTCGGENAIRMRDGRLGPDCNDVFHDPVPLEPSTPGKWGGGLTDADVAVAQQGLALANARSGAPAPVPKPREEERWIVDPETRAMADELRAALADVRGERERALQDFHVWM